MNYVISGEYNFIAKSVFENLSKDGKNNLIICSEFDLFFEKEPDVFLYFLEDSFDDLDLNKKAISTNTVDLLNALEITNSYNARFVLIGVKPDCEKFLKNPVRLAQAFAEKTCKNYCDLHQISLAVVKFHEVFGSNNENKFSLIHQLKEAKVNNKRFVYSGSENERKGFIHIDDLVSGICSISEKSWCSQTFFLGMDKNYTVKKLLQIFEIDDFVFHAIQKKRSSDVVLDTSNSKNKLNWSCKTHLENYAKKFIFS